MLQAANMAYCVYRYKICKKLIISTLYKEVSLLRIFA